MLRVLEGESDADPGTQGQEVVAAQEVLQSLVAGEDNGEQGSGIEVRGGEETEFVQDGRGDLLSLVDKQNGT